MKNIYKTESYTLELIIVMLLLSTIILILDLVTPLGIATGISYIFVIMLGYFSQTNKVVVMFSIISICLIMIGYFYSPGQALIENAVLSNRAISMVCVFLTAFFTITLKNLSLKNKKNETLLHSILSSANESVLVVNEEGKIVYNNNSAKRMFGYEEHELQSLAIKELFPIELPLTDNNTISEGNTIENITNTSFSNVNARRKNGVELPTDVSLGHFRTGEGLFLTCFIMDITKRKKLEDDIIKKNDQLEKSETFLQNIIRNLPLHIVVMDANSRQKVIKNNDENNLLDFLESAPAIRNETTEFASTNMDQIKRIQAADEELIKTCNIVTIPELPINYFNNENKFIRIIKAPVLSTAGNPEYIISIGEDIKDIVSARQELMNKNQLIIDTQEIGNVGSFERNLKTPDLIVTKELNNILGLEMHKQKYTFDQLMKLVHPDDYEQVRMAVKDAILHHEILDTEFRVIRPNKEERYIWIRLKAIYDNNDLPLFLRGLILDITERKKAYKERETYIEDLKKMLFMTSHKVRVPVANILGIANLLETSLSSPDKIVKLVAHNRKSALLLDEFTKELTVFMEERKLEKE